MRKTRRLCRKVEEKSRGTVLVFVFCSSQNPSTWRLFFSHLGRALGVCASLIWDRFETCSTGNAPLEEGVEEQRQMVEMLLRFYESASFEFRDIDLRGLKES